MARIAALDPGDVRIGVAVSDELGMLAHPRAAIDARSDKRALEELSRLAEDEEIERFVVGLPLDMRGVEGARAEKARAFAKRVADATGRPVELVDERLTTVEASRRLREAGTGARRGKGRIDSASAAVLLQAWLDRGKG